jgi:nitrite reductase (NO-forming)
MIKNKNLAREVIILLVLCSSQTAAVAQTVENPAEYVPDVTFTLETGIAQGKLVFFGRSGEIDGMVNPDLRVEPGDVIQINLINGDGAVHDVSIPDFVGASSEQITGRGSSTSIVFRAGEEGEYAYFCTIPGHRAAGMEGRLVVGDVEVMTDDMTPVSANPNNVGKPVGDREPMNITVDIETVERAARLADGTTYRYWTFDDVVPGPFLRVRQGDRVTVSLHNREDSTNIHSVDFHAVTGPGGGAVAQVPPGETRSFEFTALHPGLYVYHCATPMVAHHIANGMYGLILVEPEGGLPEVDREFYVMQGDIYTVEDYHTAGLNEFSLEKMLDEEPTYYVFNGTDGALTKTHRMEAWVGETVRIFFGVGGPNVASSFHVIGEIFDRVYREGDLVSPPARSIQTTLVPPGGSTMVEFQVDYPGRYILVDHALSRVERGPVGFLHVEGEKDESIFYLHQEGDDTGGH